MPGPEGGADARPSALVDLRDKRRKGWPGLCTAWGSRRQARGAGPTDPGSPVPLFTLVPQGQCMYQFEAQWPEPRAVRDGADWCPVSEDAEFKDTKATGSWDQLG